MGRNTGGIYSLPGSDFVSGTVISSTTMNTKFNDVEAALTDSLSRAGNGDMLAPLRVPDGSAAIPSFSWSSDIGTGFYLAATSSFRAVILASTVQEWTNTSVAINKALTTALGVTANNSTTNGAGLTATGNGTGAGVSGTGGATGSGVTGTGGATSGAGVTGTGGAASGVGGAFTGTGGAAGATGQGEGAGAGLVGTGGATGAGVRALGGTNGTGLVAIGSGTGYGATVTGGSAQDAMSVVTPATNGTAILALSGPGGTSIVATPGTVASGTVPQYGMRLVNGYLNFASSTVSPASTTAIANAVTPKNVCKYWIVFTVTAAGLITVVDGFNIETANPVVANIGRLILLFNSSAPMSGAYDIKIQVGDNTVVDQVPLVYYVYSSNSTGFSFKGIAPNTAAIVDLGARDAKYFVSVTGAQ